MSGAGNPTKPKCHDCGTATADVHAAPRPGVLPGTSLGHLWLCPSCEYLREHPDAVRRVKPPRTPAPQAETLL